MAKDKAYPQSTAITKAEPQDATISDLRKDRQSFRVFAKGVRSHEDIIDATAALGADIVAGRITIQEVGQLLGTLTTNLSVKDQQLREMEMQLRLEITGRKAKALKHGRG